MTKTFGLAAAISTIALTGAAYAQQPASGGSATGNMNNPGSVKSEGRRRPRRRLAQALVRRQLVLRLYRGPERLAQASAQAEAPRLQRDSQILGAGRPRPRRG